MNFDVKGERFDDKLDRWVSTTNKKSLRKRRKRTIRISLRRLRKMRKNTLRVRFKKRNGGSFVKRFKSRKKAARAIRAWRSKGGKVLSSY